MESAIRRTGRQPGTHDSTDPRGRTISQEHCARFRRRHPSFESISSPTPGKSEDPLLSQACAKIQPAVTSPSAADSCRVPVADSSLSVSEQMSEVVDHGKSPDSRAEDRDLNNGTSQSPVNGIEPMTPPNEADAMEIDDGGPSDSKLLAPIRLLPHMDRVESVRDRPTPVLWDDRAFFNDGELLQCPPYQETLLRASPWYGSCCALYFCCQCFMGPQVWQMNLYCSNCHVRACYRCTGWFTS